MWSHLPMIHAITRMCVYEAPGLRTTGCAFRHSETLGTILPLLPVGHCNRCYIPPSLSGIVERGASMYQSSMARHELVLPRLHEESTSLKSGRLCKIFSYSSNLTSSQYSFNSDLATTKISNPNCYRRYEFAVCKLKRVSLFIPTRLHQAAA